MEQRPEAQSPRVGATVEDQHRVAAVAGEGDLGVTTAAEDGQRAGVRVEQQHLRCREGEAARRHVGDTPDDEGQADVGHAFATGHRRHGEAERVVHVVEELGFVVEVVERCQSAGRHRVAEEGRGRRVGCQAGRGDDSAAT